MSPKFRTITAGLILFGTMISALWIITANGFMQNPVGYELAKDGSHVILTNVMELLLNPYAWYILIHTTASALLLGGIFAISVSVAKILNPKVSEEEKDLFQI